MQVSSINSINFCKKDTKPTEGNTKANEKKGDKPKSAVQRLQNTEDGLKAASDLLNVIGDTGDKMSKVSDKAKSKSDKKSPFGFLASFAAAWALATSAIKGGVEKVSKNKLVTNMASNIANSKLVKTIGAHISGSLSNITKKLPPGLTHNRLTESLKKINFKKLTPTALGGVAALGASQIDDGDGEKDMKQKNVSWVTTLITKARDWLNNGSKFIKEILGLVSDVRKALT